MIAWKQLIKIVITVAIRRVGDVGSKISKAEAKAEAPF